jgi:alpha-tubulin suppressor-like RCC1 family protein/predicted Zn-dependent protease with MMP-like domain
MRTLQSIYGGLFLCAFFLVLSFDIKAETPPINIHCPCEIERINQTKAIVSFSIAFQKEIVESGRLSIEIRGSESINYYSFENARILGAANFESVAYSPEPVAVQIDIPLRYISNTEGFLSLLLRDTEGFSVDQANFIETASTYHNPGGSVPGLTSHIMFNSEVDIEYDSSTFSLNIPSVTSTDLTSTSETLTLEMRMYNASTSYIDLASIEHLITYDENGNSSLILSGDLDKSADISFEDSPDYPNLVLTLLRDDDLVTKYTVDILGDEELPDFAQTWTNIDTLVDSDNDGIADFNERVLGSNPSVVDEVPVSIIEVAFTVGSSAEESSYGGANLDATIAYHVAVANTVFNDSGLAIELKNVGVYSVGDDSDLDASAVLVAMKARDGIFAGLDTTLSRQPDLFIHYSTVDAIDTGGKASVLGIRNDGIIAYKNAYDQRFNRGVVAIDNPALTLVHEVGHLMGLDHSRRQSIGAVTGAFPWSLGYGVDDDFVTIMGYVSSFNAARVGLFSSPIASCGSSGNPCGIITSDYLNGADAAKSLETTAFQISAISNGVAPTLTLLGDNPAYISNISVASELTAQALDREDGDLTTSISVEIISVANRQEDEYEQIYSVVDSNDNTAKLSRKIIVRDDNLDTDGDGTADYLDDDDDGDGTLDIDDAFPKDASETTDTDFDGVGNNLDEDDDNDGVADDSDAFPLDASETKDTDSDGTGDNADTDDDGDGVSDDFDEFPLDASESVDTDGDGIGNNADPDDDNDTLSDEDEASYGTNPLYDDSDFDGLPDVWELQNDRDPVLADYDIDTGIFHTCAIDDTGVVCWGDDRFGQSSPPQLSNPRQVVAGAYHSCALVNDGVSCWGSSLNGKLDVPVLSNPSQISSSYTHTCALDDTGVVCWGKNEHGQTTVPNLINPTQVSAGGSFTCALDEGGVVCWGDNSIEAMVVPGLSNPIQISSGYSASCALDDTGIVCWGNNSISSSIPAVSAPIKVAAASQHGCALNRNGVACWGYAGSENRTLVPDLRNVSNIATTYRHSCALADAGVSCWGYNANGESDVPILSIDPDGDGYNNHGGLDAFPLDKTEWLDTDQDGIGDNGDAFADDPLYSTDSDSDGMPDTWEIRYGLNPNDASDATSDQDNDGVSALDEFLAGTIPSGSLDIDGNGQYDALTDGLLLLRGMFGLDGDALVTGTVASDAAFTASVDIESRIATLGDLADIDGNGEIDALTDGLLTLRYLFGLEGDTLIAGVVASDATRTTAVDIEAHLKTLMPAL